MTTPVKSRFITVACACLAVSVIAPTVVSAQQKNQFGSTARRKPTVSPYLSTLDNGSGYGALNYYNIVRPQQRARQAGRDFQRELHTVENNVADLEKSANTPLNTAPITSGRMAPTGHSVAFGDTSNYFGGGSGGSANSFGTRNGKKR